MLVNLSVGMGMIIVIFLVVATIMIVAERTEKNHLKTNYGLKMMLIGAVASLIVIANTVISGIIVYEV